LMPYFPIMGASTYPDNAELFSNLEQVALGGQQYWLCDYAGTKDLETGKHTYSDLVVATNKPLIALSNISVTPLLEGFQAKAHEYNIQALTPVTATATLSARLPVGEKFRLPIKRTDTGRTDFLVAKVNKGGKSISITGQFATGGHWITNNKLINQAFEQPLFTMPELTFMVL
ncbi:MAG: hypothetical protein OIF38_07130, partial [Cellvibrionaceae bacterium]|nr:hypothetical protein [Cellvibrionaceae bacterium]